MQRAPPRLWTIPPKIDHPNQPQRNVQRTKYKTGPVVPLHRNQVLQNRNKKHFEKYKNKVWKPNPDQFNDAKWTPNRHLHLAAKHGHHTAYDPSINATERHWKPYNAALDPHLKKFRQKQTDEQICNVLERQRTGSKIPRSTLYSMRRGRSE